MMLACSMVNYCYAGCKDDYGHTNLDVYLKSQIPDGGGPIYIKYIHSHKIGYFNYVNPDYKKGDTIAIYPGETLHIQIKPAIRLTGVMCGRPHGMFTNDDRDEVNFKIGFDKNNLAQDFNLHAVSERELGAFIYSANVEHTVGATPFGSMGKAINRYRNEYTNGVLSQVVLYKLN
ncbi:hypothetical protein [Dongshaea marina]|uniref:hypothetical protein n=1 Tax=Dongshaea marina TaxID=2047966 RepID=UPI00131EE706|nr:hypothetical protein [Dongshaea marina]